MPKIFSQQFKDQLYHYVRSDKRTHKKQNVSSDQSREQKTQYHKWSQSEEVKLAQLISQFSTDWDLLHCQYFRNLSIIQLKNKYRELTCEYNLYLNSQRLQKENESSNNLSETKELASQLQRLFNFE
ncbi:Myb-like_DNA-binding domain-containing protein [Hexamita inflata]|uniref:Myb-like DNA-binding domain-containing protein n=1 Tax=Hexamita inflata TaxID=28002 RepID=A0AA86QC56_9EUKA|nr:Myb-like DNA-binding domain-containing protein [Hexamita inflata]